MPAAGEGLPSSENVYLVVADRPLRYRWSSNATLTLTRSPSRYAPSNYVDSSLFGYLEIFHNRHRRHTALKMRIPIGYERIHHHNNPTGAPLIQVS